MAGNEMYEKTDLAVVNHPDLFKTRWRSKIIDETAHPTANDDPQPLPPRKIIEIPAYVKGKPLPLNQLDSSLVQRVFFEYKKAVLQPKSIRGIQVNTDWLKKHPEYDILLEGHCDERGSDEYNLALGERRAQAVCSYMTDLGIDSDRLTTRSWGEEKPLDPKATEEAYALNRRVEFYAIPK
ncbi:MAG: peptidoglycan-associated lipoprotein [Candidatus Omnitrophota bacterium]|nr:MAG: peptidoglycan-associated lipoprotein [Candidatus Omnitrophota bacterium]